MVFNQCRTLSDAVFCPNLTFVTLARPVLSLWRYLTKFDDEVTYVFFSLFAGLKPFRPVQTIVGLCDICSIWA